MADNPYVNKIEYAGQTIMDLTNDTVTPSDVLNGVTFHDGSGAPQTGSMITHNVYDGLDSSSTNDALSANQGKNLNTKVTPLLRKIQNNGTVCWETSIGNLRIFSFDDDSGSIPSTGLATGETFKTVYRNICKYYNGSSNVVGMLYVNMDGTLFVSDATSTNPKKNASYIVGELIAVAD